ncbi:MAG: hypothetical protein QUV06_12250 [Cyanobium sp. CZS 48M]|nr:hypothetical protein [Cyanobium sp. CZS48M]
MVSLSIANTVSDLIQGDVLGLGTTTSLDNGELTFLHQPGAARTHLYKCQFLVGVRLRATWSSLVITVASKLCMGQRRRNTDAVDPDAAVSLYSSLQHYRLAAQDPGDPADPIHYLGRSLEWECCGFWDTRPESGRVTVPAVDAHLLSAAAPAGRRRRGILRPGARTGARSP